MADLEENVSSGNNTPSLLPTPLTSLTHLVTIKLTTENYLLWRAQMLPYLHGQDLFGYIDGSFPAPSKLFADKSPNLAYKKWFKQDQQLLSALISSLSDSLIAQVVNYNTSFSLWTAIETLFASQSQAC